MKTKRCPECKCIKPAEEFYSNKAKRDKLSSYCRICSGKEARLRRHKNKEHARALVRKSMLKMQYGITPEQYDQMLVGQKDCCAICERKETRIVWGKIARLSVHHDHKTGKVCGLLCYRCNHALGLFRDDANLIEKAIAFVRQH